MRGWFTFAIAAACLALAVTSLSAQLKDRAEKPIELPANMKDEDEDVAETPVYVFNPIQAKRELKVGSFYAKKGNHRAAAARYLEATRWNPNFAEAYWRLGRTREKLGQHQEALDAYRRYLKLEPNGKKSREAGAKISPLENAVAALAPQAQDSAVASETP